MNRCRIQKIGVKALAPALLLAGLMAATPTSAEAGDRYRGHSRSHGGGISFHLSVPGYYGSYGYSTGPYAYAPRYYYPPPRHYGHYSYCPPPAPRYYSYPRYYGHRPYGHTRPHYRHR